MGACAGGLPNGWLKWEGSIQMEENKLKFSRRQEPAESTAKTDLSTLRLLGYADVSYELYTDNGVSPDPEDSLCADCLHSWIFLCLRKGVLFFCTDSHLPPTDSQQEPEHWSMVNQAIIEKCH